MPRDGTKTEQTTVLGLRRKGKGLRPDGPSGLDAALFQRQAALEVGFVRGTGQAGADRGPALGRPLLP